VTDPAREDYERALSVLELDAGAPLAAVRTSYERLRALFGHDSIVTSALLDQELTDSRRREIMEEVERAYRTALVFIGSGQDAPEGGAGRAANDEPAAMPALVEYSGAELRAVREAQGASLDDVARATRIQAKYFRAIEEERMEALPEEVFVRGYLAAYARFLGVDREPLTTRYMQRLLT
jgi:hypothetical protein